MSRTRISNLIPILKVSIILALTPSCGLKTSKPLHRILFKCYSILLAISLTIFSVYSCIIRMTTSYDHQPSFIYVMDALTAFAGVSTFLVTTFGAAFWNTDEWLRFFSQLDSLQLEKNSTKLKDIIFSKASVIFYLGSIYTFVVSISQYLFWGYIIWSYVVCYYTEFVTLSLAFNFALVVKSKYEEIGDLLRVGCSCNIRKVRQMYVTMDEVVERFNKLLGWPLLGNISGLFCQLLNCLTSTMFGFAEFDLVPVFSMLHLAVIAFGPVTLLFCCDSATQKSSSLLTKCYKLHLMVPLNSQADKELVRLEDLLKSKPTVFTAARFFRINRSTLLYLIGTVTTYLIVIIQFRNG